MSIGKAALMVRSQQVVRQKVGYFAMAVVVRRVFNAKIEGNRFVPVGVGIPFLSQAQPS